MAITTEFPISLRDPTLLDCRGLINGEWRHATNQKTFPVYEPATGSVLHQCADFEREEFLQAINAAYIGYKNFYNDTTAKDRAQLLRRWHDLIIENVEDLAIILSLENGKTLAEAKGEVTYAATFVAWFAEEAVRNYGDVIPSSYAHSTVLTYKEPVGVCGIITPWNFPAAMITRKIAPAFAAGCSVVIKPPSETPFSAIALAKLALKAGVPSSLIHVIPTKDRKASLELASNPLVRKISFTGSTAVVFEDADLNQAVDAALICKFRASGQTCVCANRLYVHKQIVKAFAEKLAAKVRTLKLGRGIDDGTTQGPLVNAAAVEKVKAHVADALAKGGQLWTGGQAPSHLSGFFFEPTIITGATSDMTVATEETFGPLAAIFPFESEEDVMMQANASEYGLAGYFFSQDVSRIFRIARQLECGMIGVNTGLISAAESPFGGIKESGVGREGSRYGLSEYQNIKSVTIGNLG
ncbi:hypothetical protein N7534_010728 [Penicillium rubens]|nr:hypothetical protein N7534_010728 [Penicillium rubens]